MMTGIPIENNLWTAYLLTIFFVVAGFAVYDVLYRRVPDWALVFFIPLAALAPVLQGYFLLNHGLPPLFLWPVATHALVGALLGFCISQWKQGGKEHRNKYQRLAFQFQKFTFNQFKQFPRLPSHA